MLGLGAMRAFLVPVLVLVASACEACNDATPLGPDTPGPTVQALPPGDCRTTPGAISQIFTPAEYTTSSVPGGNLLVSGDGIYASLVEGGSGSDSGSVGFYEAGTTAGAAWQPFATIAKGHGLSGTLTPGTDHLYWPEAVSTGSEAPATASLVYRGEDGAAVAVPNTAINPFVSTAYLVRGQTAFTFYQPANPTPTSTPASWTLTAARVPDGTTLFTRTIPPADASMHSALVADDQFLYWSASAPSKIMRIPVAGGDPEAVPVPLGEGEVVTHIGRASNALLVAALGPRDAAMTNEIVLYRLPINDAGFGAATRTSLGRTYLESLSIAFDEASVYFAYDSLAASPSDTPRTLARTCLDGSNKTTIAVGNAFGTYSVQGMAITATRAFFTAQNRVYAFDK